MFNIVNKIKTVLPLETGNGRNGEWQKRSFVISFDGQYPKDVVFTAWGDNAKLLSVYREGDTIDFTFMPESREYNGKWYTDLKVVQIAEATHSFAPSQDLHDDLPF